MRAYTLVEVAFAMTVLAVVAFGLVSGVGAGHAATRQLERDSILFSRGQELLESMLAIEFGSSDGPIATAAELTEFFDGDDDFGSMTLHKLRRFGAAKFRNTGFPVKGEFTALVSDDLNGDGDTTDADEGNDKLLRVEILHEGRRIARTVRFDPAG